LDVGELSSCDTFFDWLIRSPSIKTLQTLVACHIDTDEGDHVQILLNEIGSREEPLRLLGLQMVSGIRLNTLNLQCLHELHDLRISAARTPEPLMPILAQSISQVRLDCLYTLQLDLISERDTDVYLSRTDSLPLSADEVGWSHWDRVLSAAARTFHKLRRVCITYPPMRVTLPEARSHLAGMMPLLHASGVEIEVKIGWGLSIDV